MVTVVTSMIIVNNTANLASSISFSSADMAKSAAGEVNCENLLDSEWFVLVLHESGCPLVLSGGTQRMSTVRRQSLKWTDPH